MAKMRIVFNQANVDALATSPAAADDLALRVAAMADACNRDSSWGGYESEVDTTTGHPVARVWSIAEHPDEARAQRLIRNLDAGA